jgi:hypothetical protein
MQDARQHTYSPQCLEMSVGSQCVRKFYCCIDTQIHTPQIAANRNRTESEEERECGGSSKCDRERLG